MRPIAPLCKNTTKVFNSELIENSQDQKSKSKQLPHKPPSDSEHLCLNLLKQIIQEAKIFQFKETETSTKMQ